MQYYLPLLILAIIPDLSSLSLVFFFSRKAAKYYTIDSGIALMVAFLINLAVVSTFAKQFYDETCATASTPSACFVGDSIDASQPNYGTCDTDGTGLCQEIGLSAAAEALRGTLGSSAKYIWAIGLLVREGQEGKGGGGREEGRENGGNRSIDGEHLTCLGFCQAVVGSKVSGSRPKRVVVALDSLMFSAHPRFRLSSSASG